LFIFANVYDYICQARVWLVIVKFPHTYPHRTQVCGFDQREGRDSRNAVWSLAN